MTAVQEAEGGRLARDPIPAHSVTVAAAVEGGRLAAGTHQFSLQIPAQSEPGQWKGSLVFTWWEPDPGQILLPVTVTVRTSPVLALVTTEPLNFSAVTGSAIPFTVTLL